MEYILRFFLISLVSLALFWLCSICSHCNILPLFPSNWDFFFFFSLSRKMVQGWSQLLFPHGAKFNFMHKLHSLGLHFACPQENITTLPPSSAVTNPGAAVTASLSWNSFPGCSLSSFSTRVSWGGGRQCMIHRNPIPALGRGALSASPVNSNIYLGNNLASLLPSAIATQQLRGFASY